MICRAARLGVAVAVLFAAPGQSSAQPPGVTATLTTSASRVAPGSAFNATFTVTNSGPSAVPIVAGIVDTYAAEIVQISAPAGLQVLGPGACALGGDCAEPLTGFRTSLSANGVAVLSLTLRVSRPPGAVFTMTGVVASDPVGASGIGRSAQTITVAGSGAPSVAPSGLLEGARTTAGIDPFDANTVVFDPTRQRHVAAGADQLANVVATLDESGLSVGTPFPVALAPGVMPLPRATDIDVAYSADLAAASLDAKVMVAWSEAQQIRTQTLSGVTMGLPPNQIGSGTSPRVVYSSRSREFLAAWTDFGTSTWRLWARRVALDGQPVGPIIDLTDRSEPQLDLTWNPVTNEYGVLYIQLSPTCCRSTVEFARLGADGTILTKTQITPAVRADQLSVAVNSRTGEYVFLWWDVEGTFAAETSGSGRVVSMGRIDTDPFAGAYSSLAFNPVSGTFLTTGRSAGGAAQFRELNQYGAPLGAPAVSA